MLVALVGLLLNALDCNGAWLASAQARKCCASGRCSGTNLDSCCKNSPGGASQTIELQPTVSPVPPVLSVVPFNLIPADLFASLRTERMMAGSEDHPPPRDLPGDRLPLRI